MKPYRIEIQVFGPEGLIEQRQIECEMREECDEHARSICATCDQCCERAKARAAEKAKDAEKAEPIGNSAAVESKGKMRTQRTSAEVARK